MEPKSGTVVQLEGLLGQTRFSLGERDLSVEYRSPLLRRRSSYPFDTIDRSPGWEERPRWAYALVALVVLLTGAPWAAETMLAGQGRWAGAVLIGVAAAALAFCFLHRRRRMVFRNYFTSAMLFQMTPAVATTPVGKQIVNRIRYADSAGIPDVFNFVDFEGGRKLVCSSASAKKLETLFLALLDAIPDEVGVSLVVVRGDHEEAEFINGKVRRDRVRSAFQEYRDILTLDGMADFCVYREGDFELVFENHSVIEIYGRHELFRPIVETKEFVFHRSFMPRYLHYHVHNVNPPENFDERIEQLKWNLQLR
jgi:hypothetical protein